MAVEKLTLKIFGDNQSKKDFKEIEDSMADVSKTSQDVGSDITKFIGGALLGIGVAAGAAAVGVGIAGLDMANQFNVGQTKMQAALGLTQYEAKELSDVSREVFKNNFGGSVAEVNDALITVKQTMKGLADDELQAVTEGAFALRDAFGVEVAESTMAAQALMRNFGLTGQEAMDFISKGMQDGMNSSGDFLESIGEYSTQFKDSGATAEEFFSTLKTGQSDGILGTDKIADSFKEFTLSVKEGTKPVREALEGIGIDADTMLNAISDGSKKPIDAFREVQKALEGSSDGIANATVLADVFRGAGEDLTKDMIIGVDTLGTSMEDLSGSTESLNKQYENLPTAIEGMKRKALMSLEPIGQAITDVINIFTTGDFDGDMFGGKFGEDSEFIDFLFTTRETFISLMEYLKQSWTELQPVFQQVWGIISEAFSTFVNEVWPELQPILMSMIETIRSMFTQFVEEWWPALQPVLQTLFETMRQVFEDLKPVIQDWSAKLTVIFGRIVDEVLPAIMPVIIQIYNLIVTIFSKIAPFIAPVMSLFVDLLSNGINTIIDVFLGLVDVLGGVFSIIEGILTGDARKIRDGFVSVFDGLAGVIGGIFRGVGNAMISNINFGIRQINKNLKLPDFLGGGGVSIPLIPRFAKGGSFITNGTQMFGGALVGDNPGGRELVTVTPLSSPNINGPDIGNKKVEVNINIQGAMIMNDQSSVRRLADMLLPEIKKQIA